MGGPVACFVLLVVGTHQYLTFFLGGKGLSLRLCVHPRGWSDDLAIFAGSAVFSPACGARKKGVAVLSARGTTQIRGGVGRT